MKLGMTCIFTAALSVGGAFDSFAQAPAQTDLRLNYTRRAGAIPNCVPTSSIQETDQYFIDNEIETNVSVSTVESTEQFTQSSLSISAPKRIPLSIGTSSIESVSVSSSMRLSADYGYSRTSNELEFKCNFTIDQSRARSSSRSWDLVGGPADGSWLPNLNYSTQNTTSTSRDDGTGLRTSVLRIPGGKCSNGIPVNGETVLDICHNYFRDTNRYRQALDTNARENLGSPLGQRSCWADTDCNAVIANEPAFGMINLEGLSKVCAKLAGETIGNCQYRAKAQGLCLVGGTRCVDGTLCAESERLTGAFDFQNRSKVGICLPYHMTSFLLLDFLQAGVSATTAVQGCSNLGSDSFQRDPCNALSLTYQSEVWGSWCRSNTTANDRNLMKAIRQTRNNHNICLQNAENNIGKMTRTVTVKTIADEYRLSAERCFGVDPVSGQVGNTFASPGGFFY
jgi:hypothetical protein